MKLDLKNIDLKNINFKDLRRGKDVQDSIPLGEPIFVDLTPPSHKKFVEVRKLKKQWSYGVFGVAAFCIATSFAVVGLNAVTEGELASERSTQLTITKDTATYASVNSALELQKVAVESLNMAAGSEINWTKLISSIEGNLPSGTRVSAISVTGGGEKPAKKDEKGVAAVINLNLSSDNTMGYSDSLKRIESMAGVESVEISGLKTESSRYTYTLSFTYDTTLLTERFTLKDKG